MGGGGGTEVVRVRGQPQGGGGTRVEGQVGGGQRVGGGQLRPGVEAQQGRGAGGVAQRGGGRDPGRENISIFKFCLLVTDNRNHQ